MSETQTELRLFLLSNNSTDVHREVDKRKLRNGMTSSTVDGNNDSESITNMFSDRYNMLYNSILYDKDNIKSVKTEIMSRIERQSNDCYCITIQDVINAVAHLKVGKSDESERLFSDHFINGNKHLHVFLSLLFTRFLVHGFSPDSMILGTMIPIPKDKKKSLCNSSNNRAIALSSILSKILDLIIFMYFKGRSSTKVPSEVFDNGEIVAISDRTTYRTMYYLYKRS